MPTPAASHIWGTDKSANPWRREEVGGRRRSREVHATTCLLGSAHCDARCRVVHEPRHPLTNGRPRDLPASRKILDRSASFGGRVSNHEKEQNTLCCQLDENIQDQCKVVRTFRKEQRMPRTPPRRSAPNGAARKRPRRRLTERPHRREKRDRRRGPVTAQRDRDNGEQTPPGGHKRVVLRERAQE